MLPSADIRSDRVGCDVDIDGSECRAAPTQPGPACYALGSNVASGIRNAAPGAGGDPRAERSGTEWIAQERRLVASCLIQSDELRRRSSI